MGYLYLFYYRLLLIKKVRVERPPSAVSVTLFAFACSTAPGTRRPQLSTDVAFPRGARQQTRRMPLLLSIDGTDRLTDVRSLHKPCAAVLPVQRQQINELVCGTSLQSDQNLRGPRVARAAAAIE